MSAVVRKDDASRSKDADEILDETLALMTRGRLGGMSAVHVPHISESEAAFKSSSGARIRARVEAMNLDGLPPDTKRALLVARHQARCWESEERDYWIAAESTGTYRSLFAATAAMIGEIVPFVLESLDKLSGSDEPGSTELYFQGCENLSRSLNEMAARTQGQASRGIFMPQLGYAPGLDLVATLKDGTLALPSHKAIRNRSAHADRQLASILSDLRKGFERLETLLGGDYRSRCPAPVGILQYEGSGHVYQDLIYYNTTTARTPEDIHDLGIETVDTINARMREIALGEGFSDVASYRAALNSDPRWRSNDPAEITARFEQCMARMAPRLGQLFHASEIPRAVPAAGPLPEFLEATMAYGCYDAPKDGREVGYFLFNAATFSKRSLIDIAPFTYHELMPGHHLHLAGQREKTDLHPFQKMASYVAFNEGWAEYGRRLAEENGMYHAAAEAFGGLCSDMRQATRLVVDTGINALGWSTEQAGQYLRDNLQVSEAEINGMLFWYGCEIPGQSLAYGLGREMMLDLRKRAADGLQGAFDLKDFHRVILAGGSRPFDVVKRDVEDYVTSTRADPLGS